MLFSVLLSNVVVPWIMYDSGHSISDDEMPLNSEIVSQSPLPEQSSESNHFVHPFNRKIKINLSPTSFNWENLQQNHGIRTEAIFNFGFLHLHEFWRRK